MSGRSDSDDVQVGPVPCAILTSDDVCRDKETLDWCVEEYPWFEDRIKCIRTLHASGPLLN